jgi:hypothetical protein
VVPVFGPPLSEQFRDIRGRLFSPDSDRAAALLTFWTRAAIAAGIAFTTITSAAAPPPPAALTAVFAFGAWLTAILATLVRLAAFAARTVLIARTTVFAAIATVTSAATSAAALTTVTLVSVAAWLTCGAAALRSSRLAAEKTFQPADKTAGLFCGFNTRSAIVRRLLRARFELAVVAAGFARFEVAWFARIARLTWFVRATFTALAAAFSACITAKLTASFTTSTLTAVAPFTRGLEGAAFVRSCAGFRGSGAAGGTVRLPTQCGAPGVFRRQNVELGFRSAFWRRTLRQRVRLRRLAGRGDIGSSGRVQRR